MRFLETLTEALKSQREPDKSEKIELKVPQLDLPKWVENLKHRRESKFKKLPDSDLHKDPSDGFFFNYGPKNNTYFESNASFSFITGTTARRRGRRRWDWVPHGDSLDQVTHEDYSSNDLNFIVDKRTKKINVEKDWDGETGNKIVAGRITRPEQARDAVKAAVHHNPELKNYTFVPTKQKVSDYIKAGAATLETGGTITAYFVALGDEMKEILKNGISDDTSPTSNKTYKLPIFFDKKVAADDAKNVWDATRLYHVIGIGEFTFSDPDLLEEEYGDFKIAKGKSVPAKNIKLIKTNFKDYFDKSFTLVPTRPDLLKTELMRNWRKKWDHVLIARNDDEFKYFENRQASQKYTKRGRKKGPDTRWSWDRSKDESNPIGLKLKNGPLILMFRPGTPDEDINKFLSKRWFQDRNLYNYMPWQLRNDERIKDAGYQIYFKKKFPEPLNYILIKAPFEEDYYKPAEDMLKALGREIPTTDED